MIFPSANEFQGEFPFQKDTPEQIRFLLKAAVRAPSTQNCQPWRFKIENDRLFVYRDTSISLPQTDSVNRYTYISIGFLIHHIEVLGSWLSMSPQISFTEEGDCIAEITFSSATKSSVVSPLAAAIFKRRNRRGVFEKKTIPESVLAEAMDTKGISPSVAEVKVVTEREALSSIAEATATNMKRVYKIASFRREMAAWITSNTSSRKDGVPGYSLNQPTFMSWMLPTIIRFVNMGSVLAKLNKAAISSAPATFGFGAPDTSSGWISVGIAASHAVLTLVAYDIDYSVFVASVEHEDTRHAIEQTFGLQQPLEFLFVAGTLPGKETWMTPRIAVENKLI
ncbi:MAG: hypothetical protein NTV60_02630 [Candidatus Kaiserbacteria bacterium]|nr:hypothetical protein [Candidatus Kaiserbacteria bacterium]